MRAAESERRETAADTQADLSRYLPHGHATATWPVLDRWFWLAIVLGAALRLWALGSSQFLDDQASLMTLAREAVLRHAVPIASIPSSISTLNPPLNVYLLMPFTLLNKDPLLAVIALAVWNVMGVALCYVFALGAFGRRVAVIGTLLFAVCPTAVGYSRFLWQQNYLPPLLILWAMAVYAGCVRGRRGMFVPATALLLLGALLHVTVLLLTPALLVGVLLAPHLPRARDYAGAIAAVALLLAPTLLWEIVSGWSDLHILMSYSSGPAKFDPEVFFRLYQALGAPGLMQSGSTPRPIPHSLGGVVSLLMVEPVKHPALGAASPYAAVTPLYIALSMLALLLFAVGWVSLTRRIISPALRLWGDAPLGVSNRARMAVWTRSVWQGVRSDEGWRGHVLLWLMVTAPLGGMLRHSSAIFTHYLIVLYPFAFLTMAFGVLTLAHGIALLVARWRLPRTSMRLEGAVALAVVAVLVIGQTAQSALSTYSVASGRFDAAVAGYGYPLSAMEQADTQIANVQRQVGASEVYIAEKSQFSKPLDYMLIRERANRIGFSDECLILPPAGPAPTLIVVSADSLSARALAGLASATHVADIPMAGNSPLAIYRFTGVLPAHLPGETSLGTVRFADSAGRGLELDGAEQDTSNRVRVHWTVLGATGVGAVPLSLRTQTRPVTLSGHVKPMQGFRDCEPTRWEAGATVFTWLPTPLSWRGAASASTETMLLEVRESTATLVTPAFGPLPLLAAQIERTAWQGITPRPLNASGSGSSNALGNALGDTSGSGQIAYDGVAVTKALLSR